MDTLQFLRQFRIGPFAIFDTVISYIGIYLLAPMLTKFVQKFGLNISRTGWLWLMFPLSVIFHFIFRQQTPFMKLLVNPESYYIGPIILLCMLYMGLKDSKRSIHK